MSCLYNAILRIKEEYNKENKELPENFHLFADNATGQNKNNLML